MSGVSWFGCRKITEIVPRDYRSRISENTRLESWNVLSGDIGTEGEWFDHPSLFLVDCYSLGPRFMAILKA